MSPIYNNDTSHLLQPNLSDEYLEDLDRLCDRICQAPNDREVVIEAKIDVVESDLPDRPPTHDLDEMAEYTEKLKYLATLESLLDLIEIGYHLEKDPKKIDGFPPVQLYPPDPDRFEDDPQEYKKREREILQKERKAQFDQSTRTFIREMEAPSRHNGKKVDVTDLIAEGEDLYDDLVRLNNLDREEIVEELDTEIQPYIQLAERSIEDEHTGLELHDIWRYFRYTWLTPYNSVPGRNINFLIRDAAREYHPVVGIASLASSMMNLRKRDQYIGWRIDAVEETLERKQTEVEYEVPLPKERRTLEKKTETKHDIEYHETEEEHEQRVAEYTSMLRSAVKNAIDESIENVRYDDFISRYNDLSEEDFKSATETAFKRLEQIEGLGTYVFKQEPPLVSEVENLDGSENVFDPEEYGLGPEDLEGFEIKDTNPEDLDDWKAKSETALFVKKRARNLQKLLRDREYFLEHADVDDDEEFIRDTLDSENGRRALKTALKEVKKRRVGAGMMNIQVCGAIPPYNHILGGKLVAMALTGPEVIDSYRSKYEGYTSKIASAMKGEPVVKNNEVAFLDTTGLFKVGSAQYDRVRVPAPSGQIEYEEAGTTAGYGSVQFGASARKRLSQVTEIVENRKAVKGRFGEGVAPKMRKIRRGIENLGLDGELLKHESPRVIYTVPLASDFREFLFGLTDEPDYFWLFDDVAEEQQQVYDHWKSRWVSKRVQKDWVLEDIRSFDKRTDIQLGYEVDFKNHSLGDF
jgi:hypothetical protein